MRESRVFGGALGPRQREDDVILAPSARLAAGIWLAFLATCIAVISRTTFTTDISAFLPRSPTPEQRVLVDQLREGVVSRLILIGIEGAPQGALAQASKRLAAALRGHAGFVSVENGEDSGAAQDREFLWRNRYLLSDAVTPERFSANALRERLEEYLRLLASPAGALARRILPGDPSGELLHILERFERQARPARRNGVWFSPDARRALLVAQTRAAGYDIDAQERAIAAIRGAFAQAGVPGATLLLTGPGVFSVSTRATIRDDVLRFFLIAAALIAALLLAIFRSPRVLALALLPVATGAAAGIAAVGLGFGAVHGVTLGFGITLLGEGVDYSIYLLTQSAPGTAPQRALDRIWPTLRLGVLTSICGFSAMLFSGFSGLAQLGLFSITGLVVAVMVTRWVLPSLLPPEFSAPAAAALGPWALAAVWRAPALRYPLLAVAALAMAVLATGRAPLWADELSTLSPVSRSEQLLDQQLRRDIGAPDVSHLVVIHAQQEEAALQAAEAVGASLREAAQAGLLEGYESPSDYLPSRRAQQARLAALPAPAVLRASLERALTGLPYRREIFEAFLKDAAAAKEMPLIERGSLQGTRLALRLDSLHVPREDGWVAMLPLRGVTDSAGIAQRIAAPTGARAVLLDLKGDSDRLYRTYRSEALTHSLAGAVAIVLLLLASLRSPQRVFVVLAPLAAAVLVTAGALVLAGFQLSIFHLMGLLLVVAVGSNYSLFFDRQAPSGWDRERTIVSLFFANATTLIGFGLLAFSGVPVLHDIGLTVGMGAFLALVFSAILARHDGEGTGRARAADDRNAASS
jgi:predicted exporter